MNNYFNKIKKLIKNIFIFDLFLLGILIIKSVFQNGFVLEVIVNLIIFAILIYSFKKLFFS